MLVGLIAKHLSHFSFYSSISSIHVYTRWSKGYPELKQNKPEIFKDWVSQNIKKYSYPSHGLFTVTVGELLTLHYTQIFEAFY